jgi:hypothetical protein
MPDQSHSAQTRDDHSDNALPMGIPLAAVIAILFLFGSTFFNSPQKSFDVAAPRLSTELPTHR